MNTDDLVSREREEEIYRERNQARRDAGGVGPLSHFDFGVGFRAALKELGIDSTVEVNWLIDPVDGCPFYDESDMSCNVTMEGCVEHACPLRRGAIFVRVKKSA